MVIRDIETSQIEQFHQLFTSIMREGYGGFPKYLQDYFLKEMYSLAHFRFWLQKGFRKILVTLDEYDTIVGYLIGDHTYGGSGFVSWVGVNKEYRESGIASKMLEVYTQYVKSKKGFLVELYTFDHLIRFYTNRGFKVIGRRDPGFFGQKNVIMNKQIGEWDPAYLR